MCGITGFILDKKKNRSLLVDDILRMSDTMITRGPDGGGYWLDETVGVGLGHRRLSIVDLSPNGHQPMVSSSHRFVISYNGEIYNFSDLRKDLEDCHIPFRGDCDTEVLLAAIEQWGLEEALSRCVGMFAFALWDRQEKVLSLVRDRMGEKPVYYGWMNKTFLFGSELKALQAHPEWTGAIDRDSLSLLLRYNHVPAPHTIWKGIYKLPPGMILTLKAGSRDPNVSSYWSLREVANAGLANSFQGDAREAVEEFDSLFRLVVREKMIADVPLGAFLSGGVDSSLIVAMMQAQSQRPINTFTIGFENEGYNEAGFSKQVAQHLQTTHTEHYVTPAEAMAVIPKLPTLYNEPFGDSSQIPTYLVSQLARQSVTATLSGDGADELFGGYHRYISGKWIWETTRWVPYQIRKLLAKGIGSGGARYGGQGLSKFQQWLQPQYQVRDMGDKFHKLAQVVACDTPENLHNTLSAHWSFPSSLVIDGAEPITQMHLPNEVVGKFKDFTQQMMYFDAMSSLPNDMLTKVDRASMSVSLEVRVPFLDHRIVDFAWSLPQALKIHNGEGKWILKRVLENYVPRELTDRPKMGFVVPIGEWIRGPLHEWAESLLDADRLKREGFFKPSLIRNMWEEHLQGKRDWQSSLWNVLMFQAWLEVQAPSV